MIEIALVQIALKFMLYIRSNRFTICDTKQSWFSMLAFNVRERSCLANKRFEIKYWFHTMIAIHV